MIERIRTVQKELASLGIKCIQSMVELSVVAALAKALRARRVLEIGTADGGWCCALASVLEPGALFVAVDAVERKTQLRSADYVHGNGSILRRVYGYSHTPATVARVKTVLDGRSVDLLHIDGNHAEKGVRLDWDLYSPLVRPGGLIVLHDCQFRPKREGIGVEPFWNELKYRYPSLTVIGEMHNNIQTGTGIVMIEPEFGDLLVKGWLNASTHRPADGAE